MRNRFFYNNNQAQAKRVRKSLKQKWTKAVCIGTLSAAMITGVPVIPPISAYTQEVYAAVSENAKIYKLSDPSLVTTKTITDFYGNKTSTSRLPRMVRIRSREVIRWMVKISTCIFQWEKG